MGWLPSFLLRWFFSKDKLRSRVHLDARGLHWALQIDGSDQFATICVTVHNGGYFRIELDRVTGVLHIGKSVEFFNIDRVPLEPDARHEVFLRGFLSRSAIDYYKVNKDNRSALGIEIHAEFNCKIHNFSVRTLNISGFQVQAFNV